MQAQEERPRQTGPRNRLRVAKAAAKAIHSIVACNAHNQAYACAAGAAGPLVGLLALGPEEPAALAAAHAVQALAHRSKAGQVWVLPESMQHVVADHK